MSALYFKQTKEKEWFLSVKIKFYDYEGGFIESLESPCIHMFRPRGYREQKCMCENIISKLDGDKSNHSKEARHSRAKL